MEFLLSLALGRLTVYATAMGSFIYHSRLVRPQSHSLPPLPLDAPFAIILFSHFRRGRRM